MRVFIFQAQWNYCGGTAVATADTFEQAVAKLQQDENFSLEKFGTGDWQFSFVRPGEPTSAHNFRFELMFEAELTEARDFVSVDYNYA